ncbi:hypothetical protein FGG08_000583 [Glutinoglossum americanum]|uniref:AAA+ ATPase domain-containing protein n=1 Tax=Glutinoglossum americanum TaxID=1670608 RepID=A0A9P8I8J9_9PEZI|nr:hypothetical protein FGG08_000583 [Glutinoglossum americanum]
MADSHGSRSSESSPSNSSTNTSISSSNQGLKSEDDQSSRVDVKTTRLVCQNCGAHSFLTATSLLTDAVASQGSNAIAEDKETKPMKRTRIGRFITDKDGHEQLVEYTDSDKTDLDLPNAGDFVFAVRSEFNFHRTDLSRPEESLVLISPSLAKAYRSVIKASTGTRLGRLGRRTAEIPEPYAPLFFYYDEISKAVENPEFACEEDFGVLAKFYTGRILPEHDKIRALLAEDMVLYDDLWAIFRTGDLIYSLDECSEPCLHMLIRTEYRQSERWYNDPNKHQNRMIAETWCIGWDHSTSTFNRVIKARAIRPFSGSRSITSLPFYPLKYYKGGSLEEINGLLTQVESRGRQWKELMSQKPRCLNYSGPARKFSEREDEYLGERIIIDGSINKALISTVGGAEVKQSARVSYEDLTTNLGLDSDHQHFDNFPKDEDFSKLQAQLCPATALCYTVKSRTWYEIGISRTEEVKWRDDAVKLLVLEDMTKKMLIGLVKQHQVNKEKVLSDIIPSKGKGLVIVLHGSPGVGKTLTAEVIAEYTKKPLYPINIGELTSEEKIVSKLQWHFTTASRWDAVLLLDEADVLLEKRSYEDFKRNGIVSGIFQHDLAEEVFLRMLEYYDGMLFLTTNRIMTIDAAFQSRIQIAIKFPDLTPEMRRQIWQNFINRLDEREIQGKKELLDHLEDMQEWNLNGRQIRNVLTTAEALALSLERRRGALRYRQVEEVANQTLHFQDLFSETAKEQKAQLVNNLNPRQFQERRAFRTLN